MTISRWFAGGLQLKCTCCSRQPWGRPFRRQTYDVIRAVLTGVGQFSAVGLAAIDLGLAVSGVLDLAHDFSIAGGGQRELDAARVAKAVDGQREIERVPGIDGLTHAVRLGQGVSMAWLGCLSIQGCSSAV